MSSLELYSFKFKAMGGENEILICTDKSVSAEVGAERVIQEVKRIEKKYSRYLPDSVLSEINNSSGKAPVKVDEETASLLNYADACYKQSNGIFDITTGVLRKVWKFSERTLPGKKQVNEVLPFVGWEKVSWKSPMLNLPKAGMEIDLGGIGKEYAVDRCAPILLNLGLTNFLVNLAGDIRTSGNSKHNTPWSVGVTDSRDGKGVLGVLELSSGAVATSGDYERAIIMRGRRYSHILNPKTGWPTSGLQSVTVVADSCLIAGSITTTAMLLGKDGEEYLNKINLPYILVTTDGNVKSSQLLNSTKISFSHSSSSNVSAVSNIIN